MTKRLVKTALAIAVAGMANLYAGQSYLTLSGGAVGGDLDSEARYGIGLETINKGVFGEKGTLSWQLGMAYSGGDTKYFDMDASVRPGYEVADNFVVGAILGVNGGSLSDSVGIYGADVGIMARYYVNENFMLGADYKHGFEKTDGDLDIDTDTVYLTIGVHF